MIYLRNSIFFIALLAFLAACSGEKKQTAEEQAETERTDTADETKYVDPGAADDPEQFKMDEVEGFSKLIAKRKDLKTPEELIRLYYNYPDAEIGSSKIMTDSAEVEEGVFEITLVHDRLMDDSMRGIKLILTAEFKDGSWSVTEAKRNWRCWEGRGHVEWGVENCS